MATVIGGNQVKLNNGQVVQAQTGGWYDGQQFWNGSLSNAGEFNSQNNQPGQQGGQAYVAPKDQSYINTQRQSQNLPSFNFSSPTMPAQNSTPPSVAPGGSGVSMPTQPSIDLNSVYEKAYNDAGITGLQGEADAAQAQIDTRRKELNDAISKINDNPFLSEANRTGRIAKLTQAAEADISNLQNSSNYAANKVAAAKADAQVKVNLATQQYNIDNQKYQQNVTLFNQLLTSGALNNIGDQDIAQIAVSTGMPTSMIRSIIQSSQAKENKPQVITVDDGVNQKLVAVDPQGNIVHSTVLGASTKTSSTGNTNNPSSPGGGEFTTTQFNQAVKVLQAADIMNQGGDKKKADKKLAPWEVQAAIGQLASYVGGDVNQAANLLALAMNSQGYSTWTP